MKRIAIASLVVLGFSAYAAAESAGEFQADRHNPASIAAGAAPVEPMQDYGVDTMGTASIAGPDAGAAGAWDGGETIVEDPAVGAVPDDGMAQPQQEIRPGASDSFSGVDDWDNGDPGLD